MGSIIRLPQVKTKTGLSRSSIYALIRANKFPKQVKLTERTSGWLETEIDQWIEQRASERDGGEVA